MSSEAGAFFEAVIKGLDAAGVAWTRNARLVRGLDYYRHTAFEFVTDRLGAQGTVLAGGRYDGLIESLGGPHTPAVGWAAGIERLGMLIDEPDEERANFAIVLEDDALEALAIKAAKMLRSAGFSCEVTASGSLKKRYSKATQYRHPDCTIVIKSGSSGGSEALVRYYAKYPHSLMPEETVLRSLLNCFDEIVIQRTPVTLWRERTVA
jgi:histidyl-tRNA synthetase